MFTGVLGVEGFWKAKGEGRVKSISIREIDRENNGSIGGWLCMPRRIKIPIPDVIIVALGDQSKVGWLDQGS